MFIFYYLILLFCSVLPFYFLPIPTWAVFVIAAIEYFLPVVGMIISACLWIWAAFVVFTTPFTVMSYIFIGVGILFIILVITTFTRKE